MYFCNLLISSASVRSILFLPFIVPIFAWKFPLISLFILKSSLVFPVLLFSAISLHWFDHWGRLSYLSLLFFETLLSDGYYLSLSPLPFTSLLFSDICKVSRTTILPFSISFLYIIIWSLHDYDFFFVWKYLKSLLLTFKYIMQYYEINHDAFH